MRDDMRELEEAQTLKALRRRLGRDIDQWLDSGSPSRRDRWAASGHEAITDDIHELLFRRPSHLRIDLSAALEPDYADVKPCNAGPICPSGRRPLTPNGGAQKS